MRNYRSLSSLTCINIVFFAAIAGCGSSDQSNGSSGSASESIDSTSAQLSGNQTGEQLFFKETFDGNGRSCGTCHTKSTGTISPQQIQDLYRTNPTAPIFRSIDSDDGVGNSYTRLLKNATIRITLNLPPNIRLHDSPGQTTFTVNRSTPTMINSSLFPNLMWDLRESSLETQALDAVHAHDENGIEPTSGQLSKIADFERTLFTNASIANYAHGGPPPTLPAGTTASEKRGRAFFNADGACGSCHSGAMLNEATASNPTGAPPGFLSNTVFAGFEGGLGFPQPPDSPNPIVTWDMDCTPSGFFCSVCPAFGGTLVNDTNFTDGYCTIAMPDPGQAIATADPDLFLFFKTPSLWGVSKTAPYFHDNSAMTLEDVMSHYDKFLTALTGVGLTAQDQTDLVNYVKLL